MNYCKRCGNPVESQDVFCGECGAVLAVPSQEPRKSSPLPYSLDESGFIRATPPLPDTEEEQTEDIMPKEPPLPDFELAEGERVIRTYHCCEFGQQRSDGILSVTNQRILFCANSDKDLCHQEMPLADWVGKEQSLFGICSGAVWFGFLVCRFGNDCFCAVVVCSWFTRCHPVVLIYVPALCTDSTFPIWFQNTNRHRCRGNNSFRARRGHGAIGSRTWFFVTRPSNTG